MSLELRSATFQDIEILLEFMAGFNQEEGIEFEPGAYRARLTSAFQYSQFVKIWLVCLDSVPVGYAVLTFTFSFEFGGIQATIDEIYLTPTQRGQGIGSSVLELLEHAAIQLGTKTLWGDISEEKPKLCAFYERAGFVRYPYRPYSKQL